VVERAPAERAAAGTAGRVVFANVPAAVHAAVHACMPAAPAGVVLSGLRRGEGGEAARRYRRMGLRVRSVHRRAGWECWVLVP
jgi:ribosomal protein L11 methylase PrmA